MLRTPGEVVARGTRSSVRAYGRGAVVKVPDATTAESWIRFEALYAEAARIAGAPVPRLLGIERVDGRVASVWERVHGESLWQHTVDAPARSAEFGAMLADVHDGLFRLVPPVTLPSQRDRMLAKIRRAASADRGHAEALELLPAAGGPGRLCHGDLHPSNVILGRDGPVIVDWFDASRGDPIADAARSLLLSDAASIPQHLPGADRATLETLTDAYLSRLREYLEIDDDLLARWQAVSAVARVAEGVPRGALLELWTRFEVAEPVHAAAN
jgi:aminoglycoside phosphotransferase (APT) family kinase protein